MIKHNTNFKMALVSVFTLGALSLAAVVAVLTVGAGDKDPLLSETSHAAYVFGESDEDASVPEPALEVSATEAGEAPTVPAEAPPPKVDQPINDAELSDLQAIANQEGISLQEAIDQSAWHNRFSLTTSGIRRAFPNDFARAEIGGGGHAWVGFASNAPAGALDMIERFTRSHNAVSVEVVTGLGFTALEIERAIPSVHYAVFKAPDALNAMTSFDFETRQIRTYVVLDSTTPDSAIDDLNAVAEKALAEATREDFPDSITAVVVRSDTPVLVIDE